MDKTWEHLKKELTKFMKKIGQGEGKFIPEMRLNSKYIRESSFY